MEIRHRLDADGCTNLFHGEPRHLEKVFRVLHLFPVDIGKKSDVERFAKLFAKIFVVIRHLSSNPFRGIRVREILIDEI